jgi:hypothetical protein
MNAKLAVLAAGAALSLCPGLASAWSGPGHLVIAAEAYRQLPPELKAEVFEVLKAHPDFPKWQKAYHPNPNLGLPAYVFMRSSTWPDEIRRSGSKYDHPDWHFIDYPLKPPVFSCGTRTDNKHQGDHCQMDGESLLQGDVHHK